MPFADLPTGARLHYIDTAQDDPAALNRPAMLLVHGMLGTAELHMGHMIEWLRDGYRVIGPTLRGYGQSYPKPRQFPHDFYQQDARDVLALMDHLGIEQAHYIGYSDGGEVGMLAGGMAPARFSSIVTIGAVGYYGPDMRPVAQRSFPATWMTQEELELHGIPDADAFILGWIKSVIQIIDSGGDLSLSLAKNITAPFLLLLGEQDTLNPQAYGQRFIDQTPNGRLVMFPCGHGIHEALWDDFKQVVGDFLHEVCAAK
jgi:valacyclovir hydrolase